MNQEVKEQKGVESPDAADCRVRIGDGLTIYRRGSRGTWTADYHFVAPNGFRRHGRTSLRTANRRVAEQKARKLLERLERNEVGTEPEPVTVAEAANRYVKSKETEGRARKTLLKYRGELEGFASYLDETHRVTALRAVTAHHCDAYKAHRHEKNKLDTYTLYNLMIVLKTFFKWCHGRRLLVVNPLAEFKVPKVRRRRHPASAPEQVKAILTLAEEWLFAVLATLAFTGLRIGELRELRPQDVDLGLGVIRVRFRDGWRPKTGASERDVPIHRRLLNILKSVKAGTRYFFTAPRSRQFPAGGNHINERDVNELFQKLAVRCGYVVGRKVQGLTLHSLRKYWKTFCLDSGVPKAMVDVWAGHEDEEEMDTFYYDHGSASADAHAKSKQWMERVPFGEPNNQDLKQLKGDSHELLD